MKRYIKLSFLGLAALAFSIVGCDAPDQEVAPIISPDNYPMVTFTPNKSGASVKEGDTIVYSIKLDKMIDRSLTFSLDLGGTIDEHDIVAEPVTLAPYTLETEMTIVFTADEIPENAETAELEIVLASLADKYLVNPKSTFPKLSLSVASVNDDAGVTVAIGWPNHDDDIDIFCTSKNDGAWAVAASSDNPEIMVASIFDADPDGEYYIGMDPYHLEGTSSKFDVSVGFSDQTVKFFNGTFSVGSADSYIKDYFDAYDMDTYRVLKIVKSGSTYTITQEMMK